MNDMQSELTSALQELADRIESGDLNAAMRLAERTRAHFPHEPEPIRLHAIALLHTGQREAALRALHQAAELAPGHIETQCNLATLEVEDNHADDAIERLRAALLVTPPSCTAWARH